MSNRNLHRVVVEDDQGQLADKCLVDDHGIVNEVISPRTELQPDEPERSTPTVPTQRVEAVDIVRGFALFGVLALNMLAFAGPTYSTTPWQYSSTWWDRAAEILLLVGGEAAFQSTFSFLFGLGFALQLDRAFERGKSRGVFARRMLILLVFGLVHLGIIWEGDVLTSYAVTGLVLLLFARSSARKVKWWSIGLGLFMLTGLGALIVLAYVFSPEDLVVTATDPAIAEETAMFQTQSFADAVARRVANWPEMVAFVIFGTPWLLSQFLAGTWFVRSGRLTNLAEQGPFLRKVLAISLPVALLAKGLYGAAIVFGSASLAAASALPLSSMVGGPALGITYSSLVLLALQRRNGAARWLSHLGPVGRMALTNYLSQSVIAVTFFYGWGLGFYGRWGAAFGIGFTLAIFAAQIAWSRWWLQRFRFGPLEWLWRTLTYGQAPTTRVVAHPRTQRLTSDKELV